MSSLSVLDLGSAQNGAIVSERWPLEPRPRERGHYSWAKLVAEQCVRNAIESHGLNAVIVRPGEVIAPGRPFLSGAAAIETRRCFVMFGNGSGSIPVTHMSELIDGLTQIERFALADRVLHVVSDNVLQQDVVRQYQKDANLKKPVVRLPLWLVLCAAGAGDWLARRLGRTSPISPYRLRAAIGRRHFHCLTPHSALDSRALDSRVSEQPADTRSVAPGIPG